MNRPSRILELDAIRGILLMFMILDHMPGFWVYYTYEPFGFISAAEFFIFLSAFLVGRIRLKYENKSDWNGWLKKRIFKLYVVHILTVVFAFTVILSLASEYESYRRLLAGFEAGGLASFVSALLLLYQPPFLDILPTYIILLSITPVFLFLAFRFGWIYAFLFSFTLWILSQVGLREQIQPLFPSILFVDLGAFDDLAWQLIWCFGLYLGIEGFSKMRFATGIIVPLYLVGALFFYIWKAPYIPFSLELGDYWWMVDKWKLGPLRLINLFLLIFLLVHTRNVIKKLVRYVGFLGYLGRHSLLVLSIHVCFTLLIVGFVEQFDIDESYVSIFLLSQIAVLALVVFAIEAKKRLTPRSCKQARPYRHPLVDQRQRS